jgi:hypothetical protein
MGPSRPVQGLLSFYVQVNGQNICEKEKDIGSRISVRIYHNGPKKRRLAVEKLEKPKPKKTAQTRHFLLLWRCDPTWVTGSSFF